MKPGNDNPEASDFKFEDAPIGAKVIGISASAALSIVYCSVTIMLYAEDKGADLLILVVTALLTGLLIALVGGLDLAVRYNAKSRKFWQEYRVRFPTILKILDWIRRGAVYIATVWYVALLSWICFITGGVESPYSVILLTIATLSPFVTTDRAPKFIALVVVTVAYLGVWGVHSVLHRQDMRAPNAILALTSAMAVVIAVLLDVITSFVAGKAEKS